MTNNVKVLITGGLGFIGHHLAPFLSKKGYEVIVIDSFYHHIANQRHNNFIAERIKILKEQKIVTKNADTRNLEMMLNMMDNYKPDFIIHLAATANAGLCNLDPQEGVDMGLMSFCGIMNALRKYKGTAHVIYSSSSMVYGDFQKPEVNELDQVQPINIYGASKLACEIFLKCYGSVYNIPYTIIRPSALYGPRCINRRITQIFIENILASKKIKIAGSGESFLDFTDVRDLCQGINLILKNPAKSKDQIFNLTYGQARQIKDLVPILKEELGEFECEYMALDPTVPKRGTLKVDKIKKYLNYLPQYPIETGYRDLIRWYKSIDW